MATWPVTLPQEFTTDNYQETLANLTIRTSMDVGPAKTRRRTISNTSPVSGQMKLTSAELDILKTFYETDSRGGIDIQWVHPRTGVACDMRFTQPPSWTSNGDGTFTVTMQMEVLP